MSMSPTGITIFCNYLYGYIFHIGFYIIHRERKEKKKIASRLLHSIVLKKKEGVEACR
jgi:hypothetical protein